MLPDTPEQTAAKNARLKELFEPFGFIVDGHMVAPMPFGKSRPIDCSCIPTDSIKSAMGALFKLSHDNSYRLGETAKQLEIIELHQAVTKALTND